jgi:hypothetical protein
MDLIAEFASHQETSSQDARDATNTFNPNGQWFGTLIQPTNTSDLSWLLQFAIFAMMVKRIEARL